MKYLYHISIGLIAVSLVVLLLSFSKTNTENGPKEIISETETIKSNKMKVEIWSDIACPFCYIGKRKFETALADFAERENVEIVWKSFQLMPDQKTLPVKSIHQLVADIKGWSLEQAKGAHLQMTQMAKQIGLDYDFDKLIPANTLNAHRFVHFAKEYGKQNEAKEVLFRSLFTDGKNIDDLPTLTALGKEIGLDSDLLRKALENNNYTEEVKADMVEGRQIGVSGVPFFVFNRKYAVNGAQESSTFLETLEKSFAEWRKENPETSLKVIEGKSCTPQGECK